jgi:hypothetical protein
MFTLLVIVVAAAVTFIFWRWTSVGRGARKRDEKLITRIDPIGRKIAANIAISHQEVDSLAARPEIRHILFAVLRQMNRRDLLPIKYSSSIDQGASALAYWLMHPNELQDAPEKVEHVETVKKPVSGHKVDFHVFRYQMPKGHWAAKDGWLLGISGPMSGTEEPYSELPGAFSRASDIEGKVKSSELVDWYIGMLSKKGLVK